VTRPEDVNLGRPPWTNPNVRVPGVDDPPVRGRGMRAGSENVRQAQRALADQGYNPGPVDGVWGQQSASATRDFQRANNLTESGRLDTGTTDALRTGATTSAPRTGTTGTGRTGMGTTGSGTGGTAASPAGTPSR